MKITEVRCILFGEQPLLRVMTDAHIDGYSQIESNQKFVVPVVEYLADFIIGLDPTNVEKVMLQIRRRGSFKPWGSAVSALEIALWDIAGKAVGLPVYKLLGGKVRDRVRVYNGGVQFELKGYEPEHYAEVMTQMKDSPEGFTVIKYPLGFHGPMFHDRQDYYFSARRGGPRYLGRGKATSDGIDHVVDCVAAMREALGTTIELALDLGPGWMLSDAIVLAQALEPYRLAWLEDMLTGDTMPYVDAEAYRILTNSTASPIHTGEQLYLRNNFMELISKRAVRVVGPDPCDVGGIAELKWIAEYADLHGIMIAPHGVFDGVLGLAAQIQVGATMPDNYIAFEYPVARPSWWYSIVEGLPDSIVNDGMIEVLERPGLGVRIIPEMARRYLDPGESGFFD